MLSAKKSRNEDELGLGHIFPVMSPEEMSHLIVPYSDRDRLAAVLQEWGVAIVPDVLSVEECESFTKQWGRDLHAATDWSELEEAKRGLEADHSFVEMCSKMLTTPAEELSTNWPASAMLGPHPGWVTDGGLPHGKLAWRARLHDRVRGSFAAIHGVAPSDLCVGMDVVFFTPKDQPECNESYQIWPHVDQNVHCIEGGGTTQVFQSLLYVWDSQDEGSTSTVILPKSHGASGFDRIMTDPRAKSEGPNNRHFLKLDRLEQQDVKNELLDSFLAGARRIPMMAGGLLLWSSRTIHQGHAGGPRLSVPICWEPKIRRSETALNRKMRLAALGRCTTHWASVGLDTHQHYPLVAKRADAMMNQLPLKATLRPATLQDGADTTDIEQHFFKIAATSLTDPHVPLDPKWAEKLDTDPNFVAQLNVVLNPDVLAAL